MLGLIGAFLAKGANEPFGGVYIWLFEHIPGFIMFRDPSKFYLLIALSYSVLIPFSILYIYNWLSLKLKTPLGLSSGRRQNSKLQFKIQNFIPKLFLLFIGLYLLFLIRPAIFGELGGTLKEKYVPSEYIRLREFLSEPIFFRTLWIPTRQRFGLDNKHPQLSAQDLFKTDNDISLFNLLKEKQTENTLREAGVKYIIVPYDSEKEIFLKDRKYNNQMYKETIRELDSVTWLNKVKKWGMIVVYELKDPKDHFWSLAEDMDIEYIYRSPSRYTVFIKNAKKNNQLIFTEAYDRYWIGELGQDKIVSKKYGYFNSFTLSKNGNYTLEIVYGPQKWVNIGLWISITTLVTIVIGLIFLKRKNNTK